MSLLISFVFDATSETNLAPMFSKWSSNSISLAMVTPSLVINGEPNDFLKRHYVLLVLMLP